MTSALGLGPLVAPAAPAAPPCEICSPVGAVAPPVGGGGLFGAAAPAAQVPNPSGPRLNFLRAINGPATVDCFRCGRSFAWKAAPLLVLETAIHYQTLLTQRRRSIEMAYESNDPQTAPNAILTGFIYNIVAEHDPDAHTLVKRNYIRSLPPGAWDTAESANPDPSRFVPFPVRTWEQLRERVSFTGGEVLRTIGTRSVAALAEDLATVAHESDAHTHARIGDIDATQRRIVTRMAATASAVDAAAALAASATPTQGMGAVAGPAHSRSPLHPHSHAFPGTHLAGDAAAAAPLGPVMVSPAAAAVPERVARRQRVTTAVAGCSAVGTAAVSQRALEAVRRLDAAIEGALLPQLSHVRALTASLLGADRVGAAGGRGALEGGAMVEDDLDDVGGAVYAGAPGAETDTTSADQEVAQLRNVIAALMRQVGDTRRHVATASTALSRERTVATTTDPVAAQGSS